jgi:hypothetical protein
MVRGRPTAPAGLILGHEITGEVIEKGSDVEMLSVGDLVTVPFQYRMRPLPQLPRREDRDLSHGQSGPPWRRLRPATEPVPWPGTSGSAGCGMSYKR